MEAGLSAEGVDHLDDAPATDGKPRAKPRIIAMRDTDKDSTARDRAEAASSVEIEAAMKIQKAVRLRQVRIAKGELKPHTPGTAIKSGSLTDVIKAVVVVDEKRKLADRIAQSEAAQLFREKVRLQLPYSLLT